MLNEALRYANLGWAVFPVSATKKPLTENGFKDATTSSSKIKSFWRKFPEANIGIATGAVSGLIVLDVDPSSQNDAESIITQLIERKGIFAQDICARSGGGGFHFYFQHPGKRHVPSTSKLFSIKGLDLRADGGYIIAPPSNHISGAKYVWLDEKSPFENTLPECPVWILDIKRHKRQILLNNLTEPIIDGNRNTTLASVAGLCRSLGLDKESILEILLRQNTQRCQPPLSEEEVSRIANHMSDYPPFNTRAAGAPTVAHEVLLNYPRTDAGFAEMLSTLYLGQVRYEHTSGSWYLWRDSYWERDLKQAVYQACIFASRQLLEAAGTIDDEDARISAVRYALKTQNKPKIDAALSLVRSFSSIATVHNEWDTRPDILACLNGTLNLETGDIRESSADDLISHYIPHKYDPHATCPTWENFLQEIFDGNQEVVDFVKRAVGYSMTGRTDEQCIFVMIGRGSNGKSTFLEVLHSLFGNCAMSAPFSTFERTRGSSQSNDLAALAGKRLVFSSEPNQGVVFDESRIKSLTGGDMISARFLHKEFFQFQAVCKIWMGVNHLPRVKDDSDGFWRRIRRIDFPVRFYNPNSPHPEGAKLQDPELLGKLLKELPGILNWALEGAQAWYSEGLSIPQSVVEATKQYRDDSDPLYVFFNTCVAASASGKISLDELYKVYTNDCDHRGLRKYEILAMARFKERLQTMYERTIVEGSPGVKGLTLTEQGQKYSSKSSGDSNVILSVVNRKAPVKQRSKRK